MFPVPRQTANLVVATLQQETIRELKNPLNFQESTTLGVDNFSKYVQHLQNALLGNASRLINSTLLANSLNNRNEKVMAPVADAAGDMLKMYLDLMKELLTHARENKSTLDVSGLDQTGNPGGPSTS